MLRSYLAIAIKVLLRRKLFTAISLFGISFTLMVLVVAVAIVDHAVGPMPPEVRLDRLLQVRHAEMLGRHMISASRPGYKLIDRYVRNLPGVERMSVFVDGGLIPSYVDRRRIDSRLRRTDGEFWKVLDFTFLEGGPFSEDDVRQARFVAVISESTRARFFPGAPALGRTIELDRQRFQVVGVVPDVSPLRDAIAGDVWAPLTTARTNAYRDEMLGSAGAILLARSRADIPKMKEELRSRVERWESPDPRTYQRLVTRLETPFESLASGLLGNDGEQDSHVERLWLALALTALLFMLLPAVNLVNLNVSRILERASEIGVRKAFGASSRALVTQFVVENILLTLVGAAVALLLSLLVLRALTASDLFGATHFALNGRVFLFGLALAVIFGLVSGVYPAWKMSRLHPLAALHGGGR
jgi:putative ABC transport system permease protein